MAVFLPTMPVVQKNFLLGLVEARKTCPCEEWDLKKSRNLSIFSLPLPFATRYYLNPQSRNIIPLFIHPRRSDLWRYEFE